MMKKFWLIGVVAIFMLMLAACSGEKKAGQEASANPKKEQQAATDKGEVKTIEYLNKKYTVPKKAERIVITGAMEAMEDAVALEVEPVGAVTVAGKFPEVYATVMKNTESIGEKQQPDFEKIIKLKPDVILGTTKFQKEVVQKLEKIAPTILVSHISSDWKDNLRLMGELSGKTDKANKVLADYEANMEKSKASLQGKLKDKKVVALRIRGGQVFVYPEDVFFNPVLYKELGLEVPEEVKKAKTQESISAEQLAMMNPDYIFMQVQGSGKQQNDSALEELKKNPIMQQVNAFKNNKVFVNVVDPLMEGGPVYSRAQFLEKVQKHLEKE